MGQENAATARTSTFDNFTYEGACDGFHSYIIRGKSQPYPRELKLVKKYLSKYPNKNNTYLDIGAHIGTTALPYSRLFKNVIAYEASAENYKHLVNNINFNKSSNIVARNIGVSDTTTQAKVVKYGRNSGTWIMGPVDLKEDDPVNVIKLDDEEINNPVDFIKIDVEGSDLRVLKGAKELIEKHKPLIQVETKTWLEDERQLFELNKFWSDDKQEIFNFMSNAGYKIFDDNGNDPLFYHKDM